MERNGQKASERRLGIDAERIEIADDFDAPLPEEVLAAFQGRSAGVEEFVRVGGSSQEEPSGPAGEDLTRSGP